MSKSVLVVAGEISGDMHAARVVRAVAARRPDVRFFGIGGDEMQAAGVAVSHHVRDMAVLGLVEVLRRYGFFRRVFRATLAQARARRPDAVLLVDYPGFNLRFAAAAHDLGVKVLYYVCPQVWAWHRSRIPKMARIVDRLMVIFPFEVDVFKGTGLRADFVGHPLVEETRRALAAPEVPLPWAGQPRVALLPGSRRQEVQRILPDMWAAAVRLQAEHPEASFLVASASAEIEAEIRAVIAAQPAAPARWRIVTGETRQILRQARAAMVASGTATLETALMDCPMIVVYRTSALTYFFGRLLIRVPFLGMVNLLAGRELCPEFLQGDATPAKLAAGLAPLLRDGRERSDMLAGLADVREQLGDGGAAERAADILLAELGPP